MPFATSGIHGLSQLNVWWMRLGIQHQRIHPAPPAAERRARAHAPDPEAQRHPPPRDNARAQQRAFNRFRAEYNDERPARIPGGQTPASRYRPSPRPYPSRLPPQEYPGHFLVKKITTGGTFRFQHRLLFIATA